MVEVTAAPTRTKGSNGTYTVAGARGEDGADDEGEAEAGQKPSSR